MHSIKRNNLLQRKYKNGAEKGLNMHRWIEIKMQLEKKRTTVHIKLFCVNLMIATKQKSRTHIT